MGVVLEHSSCSVTFDPAGVGKGCDALVCVGGVCADTPVPTV